MSVLRPKPPEDPISLTLGPLEHAATARLAEFSGVPREGVAHSLQPARLLGDYMQTRPSSQLFETLALARMLADAVDAVAVVCRSPLGHALQGMFQTCCHPFHNHLSRGERGGRPRLFIDVALGQHDPDRTAGLIDLIAAARSDDLLERWGMLMLAEAHGLSDTRAPAAGGLDLSPYWHQELEVGRGPLADVFSPAVLLTASVAGIDVVRFLGGGAAMLRRFQESPAETNPPMLLAAAMRAAEPARLALTTQHAPAADALCHWWAAHEAPLANPGSPQQWPCELHSLQPRREGEGWHALHAPATPDESGLDRPPANRLAIILPRLDEHTLGQLFALRLIAARLVASSIAGETVSAPGEPETACGATEHREA